MIKDLPEDILVQISCAFNLFDGGKKGKLKQDDFIKVFKQMGIKLSDENMKEMMSSFDSEEDINITNFVSFINKRMKNIESEEEILEVFKIFDKRGSGKVSIGDIRSVLDDIDESISQQELEDLMDTWDKDKDGYLDYLEFKEMMESK